MESFAEVVSILSEINVVATVPVCRILVSIRILVAKPRTILPVGLSCANALLVAVGHGLPEHICTILIRLVGSAATRVAIARRRIPVRTRVQKTLVLTHPLEILLLKTQLRLALLLLQYLCPLYRLTVLPLSLLIILTATLLLDELLLSYLFLLTLLCHSLVLLSLSLLCLLFNLPLLSLLLILTLHSLQLLTVLSLPLINLTLFLQSYLLLTLLRLFPLFGLLPFVLVVLL
jgi:hypothetical protein